MSKRTSWHVASLLVAAALARPASAQEQLDERAVIVQALKEQPTLRAALLDRERAQARVRGERARYPVWLNLDGNASTGKAPELTIAQAVLPSQEQFGGGAQLSKTFSFGSVVSLRFDVQRKKRQVPFFVPSPITGMPTARLIDVGPGYYYDGTFSFTQPLLRGFGRSVGELELRAARLEVDRASKARDQNARELLRDVLIGYWELWYAQAALRIQRAALKVAEQEQRGAASRAQAGALARVDVLEFETRVAQLREECAKSELTVSEHAVELARLIGRDLRAGAAFVVADLAPPALDPPRSDDLERALERSPALEEARAALTISHERAEVAGEALRPKLDATGQVVVHGLGDRNAGDGLNQFGSFKAVTALATLTYQIALNNTQKRMERRAAKLEVEAQSLRIRELERKIVGEVLRLHEEDRGVLERLGLSEQCAALGRELALAAEERFAQGALTAVDVVLARQKAQEAELRVARLRVDLVRSRVQRLHLTGRLTELYAPAL